MTFRLTIKGKKIVYNLRVRCVYTRNTDHITFKLELIDFSQNNNINTEMPFFSEKQWHWLHRGSNRND